MTLPAWSKVESEYSRHVGHYDMHICRTDSKDKDGYLWRIWGPVKVRGPVKVGPSIVKRLIKSGCVSNLSDAKQSCVRAMRKHAKLMEVKR